MLEANDGADAAAYLSNAHRVVCRLALAAFAHRPAMRIG